jgi:hypothetical protein
MKLPARYLYQRGNRNNLYSLGTWDAGDGSGAALVVCGARFRVYSMCRPYITHALMKFRRSPTGWVRFIRATILESRRGRQTCQRNAKRNSVPWTDLVPYARRTCTLVVGFV